MKKSYKLSDLGYSTNKSKNKRFIVLLHAIEINGYLSVLQKLVALKRKTSDSNPEQSKIYDFDIKKLQEWKKLILVVKKNIKMKGGGPDEVFNKKIIELSNIFIKYANRNMEFKYKSVNNHSKVINGFFYIKNKLGKKVSLLIYDKQFFYEFYYPSYYSNIDEYSFVVTFWNTVSWSSVYYETIYSLNNLTNNKNYMFNLKYLQPLQFLNTTNKDKEVITKLKSLVNLKGELTEFKFNNTKIIGRFYPIFNKEIILRMKNWRIRAGSIKPNDFIYHEMFNYIFNITTLINKIEIIGGFILKCNEDGTPFVKTNYENSEDAIIRTGKNVHFSFLIISIYLIPSQYGLFTWGKTDSINFYKNVVSKKLR